MDFFWEEAESYGQGHQTCDLSLLLSVCFVISIVIKLNWTLLLSVIFVISIVIKLNLTLLLSVIFVISIVIELNLVFAFSYLLSNYE